MFSGDRLEFQPLDEPTAQNIISWEHPPPYDLYNLIEENLPILLNPDNRYYAVRTGSGELIGYCCLGDDARVPGGSYRVFEPGVLDIGVGLRPDWTGKRFGETFIQSILQFSDQEFQPAVFRVSIADFNLRSRRAFEKVGFQSRAKFQHKVTGHDFWILELNNPARG
jgi:[ribosomal protein S18]-alanine N-acetyltransferase